MHRAFEILKRARIGPRDDEKIAIAFGGHGCANLRRHLLGFDETFARQMSATFRKFLVFEMTTGQSGALQFVNRASDIFRAAETGIGIHDRRNFHRPGNEPARVATSFSVSNPTSGKPAVQFARPAPLM